MCPMFFIVKIPFTLFQKYLCTIFGTHRIRWKSAQSLRSLFAFDLGTLPHHLHSLQLTIQINCEDVKLGKRAQTLHNQLGNKTQTSFGSPVLIPIAMTSFGGCGTFSILTETSTMPILKLELSGCTSSTSTSQSQSIFRKIALIWPDEQSAPVSICPGSLFWTFPCVALDSGQGPIATLA